MGRWSQNCFCLEVPTFRTIRQKGVKTTAVKRFAQINIREAWARRPGYSDRRHNICLWAFQICALKINRAESPNIQRKYFHKIVLKNFFYLAGMFVHAAEQQRRSDAACEACSASTLPELWLILWASQHFCRINSAHWYSEEEFPLMFIMFCVVICSYMINRDDFAGLAETGASWSGLSLLES